MIRIFIIISFFSVNLYSQALYDTIINKGIYKSYFSYALRQPLAVTYTLYQGGGPADRSNDHFTNDTGIPMQADENYLHSGYDRGHLVPAEDFAYSDSLQALTFKYYNCVPQLAKLNRGPWKSAETKARKISQRDTIVVVCYNLYGKIKNEGLNVPSVCYKAVFNIQGKLLFSVAFENSGECEPIVVSTDALKKIHLFLK